MLIPTMYTWKKQPEPDLIIIVYFEDGIPDDYRYCLSLEGEHMIYHKFTPEDYEDFGF